MLHREKFGLEGWMCDGMASLMQWRMPTGFWPGHGKRGYLGGPLGDNNQAQQPLFCAVKERQEPLLSAYKHNTLSVSALHDTTCESLHNILRWQRKECIAQTRTLLKWLHIGSCTMI